MAEKSHPSTGTTTTDGGTPADVAVGPRAPRRSEGPRVKPRNGFDRYFEISARRSTTARELRGGLTTFFTMAYIVVLNPSSCRVRTSPAPRCRFPRSPPSRRWSPA
jgi:AGZA family xanthine/uracil permease-like MFS transporter